MTDAVTRETRLSGFSLVLSAWHDPAGRILNVDLLTVLIALLLPWSTTGGPFYPANGILVKNYIAQSQEFVLCAVALAYPVMTFLRANRIALAALFAAIAASFVLNMMFVVISRTALVTMPIILAVFALVHLRLRTALAVLCAGPTVRGAGLERFSQSARNRL